MKKDDGRRAADGAAGEAARHGLGRFPGFQLVAADQEQADHDQARGQHHFGHEGEDGFASRPAEDEITGNEKNRSENQRFNESQYDGATRNMVAENRHVALLWTFFFLEGSCTRLSAGA